MTWAEILQMLGAAIGGGGVVQVLNAYLRKDSVAVQTAAQALDLATKAFELERNVLLKRIDALEAEVAAMKERGA